MVVKISWFVILHKEAEKQKEGVIGKGVVAVVAVLYDIHVLC